MLARLRNAIDPFLLLLLVAVALAAVLPAAGGIAQALSTVSYFAVALLFFIYGARLPTSAVVAGIANWRPQLLIFLATFLLYPLLGLGFATVLAPLLTPELITGLIFLSVLPSTVNSSIALTSLARGNVAAAICAASISNLAGVVLAPALAALLLASSGIGFSFNVVLNIATQLLLPFVLGQLARLLVGDLAERHVNLTRLYDRATILLIVYTAFSASVAQGAWSRLDPTMLALVILADIVMLALALAVIAVVARRARLPRGDRIATVFAGGTKSMVAGVPMANLLFGAQAAGIIVLPLIVFHQLQLFVYAFLAQRYARDAAKA